MPSLGELIDRVEGARIVSGAAGLEIAEVRDDSREVRPGDLFVAVPGTKHDGRVFIREALAKGAVAILSEDASVDAASDHPVAVVAVPSARKALGVIAANRFGAARSLCLTAVTGTNGKTTSTYLVEAILGAAGRRVGVIGTVGYRFGGQEKDAALTTPGALELHRNFAEMKQRGATDVVMEASSIALEQGRLAGCRFRAAALTNVTQDHLDYHGTMERYFAAKLILFRELLAAEAVVVCFADDQYGHPVKRLANCPVLTVSRRERGADVVVLSRDLGADGTRLRLGTPVGPIDVVSPLVGEFNVDNILTAVGLAIGQGVAASAIVAGIARLRGVPGRLQPVANESGVLCVVDYAHTPDALERALDVLRPLTKGRLICVFGCGGDRDRAKRPLMGEAAVKRADVTFVTSDNPRTEEPAAIIDMILEGARRAGKVERSPQELADGETGFAVEPDRWAAISRAVSLARMGDVLLLAGKGHENYQIIGTEKSHFDDREIAAAAFAARRSA